MNQGRTIFSLLLDWIPKADFDQCVQKYKGNYRVRTFSCFVQFLTLAFAQLTARESLRVIETCLRVFKSKLYHSGFRGRIARSTLADACEHRNWRIYQDFANLLIGQAKALYAEDDFGLQLDQPAYALDASTIDLCLALFPWASFRKNKAAIKLHTLLDLRRSIPSVVIITLGKVHDVNIMDDLFF